MNRLKPTTIQKPLAHMELVKKYRIHLVAVFGAGCFVIGFLIHDEMAKTAGAMSLGSCMDAVFAHWLEGR